MIQVSETARSARSASVGHFDAASCFDSCERFELGLRT